jgi:hypothetical protein
MSFVVVMAADPKIIKQFSYIFQYHDNNNNKCNNNIIRHNMNNEDKIVK